MQYVYGPIPSRRLGQSLGVDPIPLKTCNWNCIYCQLGRTFPLINERGEWAPRAAIVAEVAQAVAAHPPHSIDHVSFVGSGEPTLHEGLGWMVREVKRLTAIPVAVITNGALLGDAQVRAELLAADVVMPTLTAGTEDLFRRIHRPHPELTLESMVAGLEKFRQEYRGQLWIEVMLMRGVNDDDAALHALAAQVRRIQPDQVHLIAPERPAAEPWVESADAEGTMRATAILGNAATVVHPAGSGFDLSGHATLLEAIYAILVRHPISEEQLAQALVAYPASEAAATLAALAESDQVRVLTRHGLRFWTVAEQRFSENGKPA